MIQTGKDMGRVIESLKGKNALITGAARGIGQVAAHQLARNGACVGLIDILPEVQYSASAVVETGTNSAWAIVDISDPCQVDAGVEEIRSKIGDIDILVNNAGIVNNIAPLKKMTHEAWNREVSVNLSGAFHMIQAVIRPMAENKWGRIINVSSLGASGGLKFQAGYAASKAGLLGLTKTVTLEHACDGITCNAILPGMIQTEMVQRMPDEIIQNAKTAIPSGRFGRMEEVAALIAFLATDEAGFINGAEIHIDGGMRLNQSSLGSRQKVSKKPK